MTFGDQGRHQNELISHHKDKSGVWDDSYFFSFCEYSNLKKSLNVFLRSVVNIIQSPLKIELKISLKTSFSSSLPL